MRKLVGAVGIVPSALLNSRKLFILRYDKIDRIAKNAEIRYTAGTRFFGRRGKLRADLRDFVESIVPPSLGGA